MAEKSKSIAKPSDYGLTKKQASDLIKLLENKAPENANYFRKLFKMSMNKGGATMKKKTKYMSKGGMKKTKYMSKGGAGMKKKTKYMSRGGAARRK